MRNLVVVCGMCILLFGWRLPSIWSRHDPRAATLYFLLDSPGEEVPRDPWGQEFVWVEPRQPFKGRYSIGPNCRNDGGTGDDIGPFEWPDLQPTSDVQRLTTIRQGSLFLGFAMVIIGMAVRRSRRAVPLTSTGADSPGS